MKKLALAACAAWAITLSPAFSCYEEITTCGKDKIPIEYGEEGNLFCVGDVGDRVTVGDVTIEALENNRYRVSTPTETKVLVARLKYKCPGSRTPRYLTRPDPRE